MKKPLVVICFILVLCMSCTIVAFGGSDYETPRIPLTTKSTTGSTPSTDTFVYSPFVQANYRQQNKMAGYTVLHGVDLSYHNGDVDFAMLKNAGVDFVILRVGYRGYGASGNISADNKFAQYYSAAKAQGLDVGVYFYSQALNESEAREEANFTLSKIRGLQLDLPVYCDYEFSGVETGRVDAAWSKGTLTRAVATANVNAFCEVIKNAGFALGVYSGKAFLEDNLNMSNIDSDASVWLAHYTSTNSSTGSHYSTSYAGDYEIWQYSSKGTVSGVSSQYVDCNFLYKELMDEKLAAIVHEHNYIITAFDKGEITFTCEACGEAYTEHFSDYLNGNDEALDMNNDGIVNGKDYAYLNQQY